MKLEVLGSGGAVATPKPFCRCESCLQAKEHGVLYSRLGPSVFVHGPDILIDTPEEISTQINRSQAKRIAACLFSHWHPDHTAGKRLFEMNIDWVGLPPRNACTKVILTEKVASTFESCMSIMEHLKFFESRGIIELQIIGNNEEIGLDSYSILPIQLNMDYVFGYQIRDDQKRILVIMDELKNWEPSPEVRNAEYDLVYLPFGIFDVNPLDGQRNIDEHHPLLNDEQTIEETMDIVKALNSKRFVLSHIEEPDNITFDLAKRLSDHFSKDANRRIEIAYDTMMIEV